MDFQKTRICKQSTSCKAEDLPYLACFLDRNSPPAYSSIVHLSPHIQSSQYSEVMDPNYVDEEEGAAAMAAMMGFSGFGSQKPPAKKRKFTTDAFVEGQDVMALDKGGKKGQGSGGNTMPLGKTRVLGTGSATKAIEPVGMNDSEIDLGDDDDTDGPQYVDTSLPPPILADKEGPRYEPPPCVSEEAKEMQSRIDASSPGDWVFRIIQKKSTITDSSN